MEGLNEEALFTFRFWFLEVNSVYKKEYFSFPSLEKFSLAYTKEWNLLQNSENAEKSFFSTCIRLFCRCTKAHSGWCQVYTAVGIPVSCTVLKKKMIKLCFNLHLWVVNWLGVFMRRLLSNETVNTQLLTVINEMKWINSQLLFFQELHLKLSLSPAQPAPQTIYSIPPQGVSTHPELDYRDAGNGQSRVRRSISRA